MPFGLLVGGVLVGRDLIQAATNRAQVSQIEKYTAAINTFRMKYNALPADILNPVQFGLNNPGNPRAGDGVISSSNGNVPITTAWLEPYYVFIHLSDARLIEGKYQFGSNHYVIGEQFPVLKANPAAGMTVSTYENGLWFFLGISQSFTDGTSSIASLSQTGVLSPPIASYVDAKLDDNNPGSGQVRAVTHTNGTLDTTLGQCVSASSATAYNMQDNTLRCRLYVRSGN